MKIKKIIAREGLILLGIAAVGLLIYFIGRHMNEVYLIQHPQAKFKVIHNMKYSLMGYRPYIDTMDFGLNLAIFGYPFAATARFILWAFKTLKKR